MGEILATPARALNYNKYSVLMYFVGINPLKLSIINVYCEKLVFALLKYFLV